MLKYIYIVKVYFNSRSSWNENQENLLDCVEFATYKLLGCYRYRNIGKEGDYTKIIEQLVTSFYWGRQN